MQIITQAIRVIDYENNIVSSRQIMPKFEEYIEQLVDYISKQTSVREYKTQSVGTEVVILCAYFALLYGNNACKNFKLMRNKINIYIYKVCKCYRK